MPKIENTEFPEKKKKKNLNLLRETNVVRQKKIWKIFDLLQKYS